MARHSIWRCERANRCSKYVDWYMDGQIEIDPMITHTLPLEKINEAFDLMHEGKSIRAVIKF